MSLVDVRSPNLSQRSVQQPAVRSKGGVVVAQNRLAASIGVQILQDGGSAVDAAVATSMALGVLEPWMSGLGGLGAMLVGSAAGAITTIDAGAVSPKGLRTADFPLAAGNDGDLFGWPNVVQDRNVIGATSVCVPGLLAGLALAHQQHGRLPWRDLVAPAVDLAAQGPVIDYHSTLWIATEMGRLQRNAACREWLLPSGLPPVTPAATTGKLARLAPPPQLQGTLQQIAEEGVHALYHGDLGRKLVEDVQAEGGYLQAEDLAGFSATAAAADCVAYRQHRLHFVPGLNGGITVAQAMQQAQARFAPAGNAPDASAFLAYCDAMAVAWEQRFAQLGHGADAAAPTCTSHLNVIDQDGLAVSLTQTLLSAFGSGLLSPQTGILLNNGINWFDPRPGRINSLAAGRKALANYCPVLMTGPGEEIIAMGGSGGRKIIPAVFQALAQMADYGMGLQAAIDAPRLDTSAFPTVVADARLDDAVVQALAQLHPVVLAARIEHLCHFTILGGARRAAGISEGYAEPHHSWADAVAQPGVL